MRADIDFNSQAYLTLFYFVILLFAGIWPNGKGTNKLQYNVNVAVMCPKKPQQTYDL